MRILISCLLAILIWPTGLLAEGKITIDPNVPGAREAEETATDTDPRLDQKVTLEAKQKSVLTILAELSEKTGVTLKAGQNSKDWESQDTKMNIFVKDVPLRELMASMARVMKFRWSREAVEGNYSYRFYMTRKTKLDAEARRAREEDERQKRLLAKRSKALDTYSAAANLSPEELATLKTENPFLYVLHKTGILDSLGTFLRQTPAVAEALTAGRGLNISAGTLSPDAQQWLLKAMQQVWQFENKMADMERPFPDDIANNIGQVNVSVNRHIEFMEAVPRGRTLLLGALSMSYGSRDITISILDPEGEIAKLLGKALVKSEEEGLPLRDAIRGLEFEATKIFQAETKKADDGEPEPEHPDEPELHTKIKFKPEDRRLPAVQAELAKASGLSVVSDSYGPGLAIAQFSGEETDLKTILDRIATAYQCNWEKHGSILEFRDRKWYEKRAGLVPESLLESWRQTLKKTGTLDIADLVQVASLTTAQAFANLMTEDEAFQRAQLLGIWIGSRDVLRLYGSLTETQQATVFARGGLDLQALTPEQWILAEKLISSKNASYLADPEIPVTLSAKRTPYENRFRYVFTVAAEGMDPLEWSFTTPLYREPQPKASAPATSDPSSPSPPPTQSE